LVFSKTYTTGIGFAPNISNNKISNILPYFVRSGLLNPYDGKSLGAGQSGGYWSSYGSNTTNAYNPGFNASLVYPSHGPWERYYARPLRCL